MLELLHLPEVTHEIYERSPLELVICQVRFAPVIKIADEAFVARFQDAIREQYPLLETHKRVEIVGELGADGPTIQQRGRVWRFVDQEDNWAVALADDFLVLETRAYEYFDDFLRRFREVLEVLFEYIRPTVLVRLGLRYINEIRPGRQEWHSIIRSDLLGVTGVEPFASHVAYSLQEFTLRFPSGEGITVRHGIIPTGSVVVPRRGREQPAEPFYLLDYDAFIELGEPGGYSADSADPDMIDMICERVAMFNQLIYRIFRWSITDEYRQSLGRQFDGSQ